MRIAFLNKYQNKVNRGAETFIKEVSQRLSRNHEVDVISDINYFNLLKEKYDVVIPTNGRFQVILARLITWITAGKMVVSGQSGIGLDDRINLYSFPNYFIPISTQALNWARRVNPLVKSVYIPNGVDINKFRPDGGKLEMNLKKPVILCVAALTKTKRVDLVVEAVSKIKDASLLIVGKGGEEENLRKLGNRLLGERFRIINLPYENMPEAYRVADLFTLVSEPYYSFENVLVEAMATNIPVVANNDPIRKEIVGEGGLLVDPKNIDKYREALETALKTNWGNKLREQAKKFDWDEIAEKYDKIIKEL